MFPTLGYFYISWEWAHAFISLSLKATVNIWIIKTFGWRFISLASLLSFQRLCGLPFNKGVNGVWKRANRAEDHWAERREVLDIKVLTNERSLLEASGIIDERCNRKETREQIFPSLRSLCRIRRVGIFVSRLGRKINRFKCRSLVM